MGQHGRRSKRDGQGGELRIEDGDQDGTDGELRDASLEEQLVWLVGRSHRSTSDGAVEATAEPFTSQDESFVGGDSGLASARAVDPGARVGEVSLDDHAMAVRQTVAPLAVVDAAGGHQLALAVHAVVDPRAVVGDELGGARQLHGEVALAVSQPKLEAARVGAKQHGQLAGAVGPRGLEGARVLEGVGDEDPLPLPEAVVKVALIRDLLRAEAEVLAAAVGVSVLPGAAVAGAVVLLEEADPVEDAVDEAASVAADGGVDEGSLAVVQPVQEGPGVGHAGRGGHRALAGQQAVLEAALEHLARMVLEATLALEDVVEHLALVLEQAGDGESAGAADAVHLEGPEVGHLQPVEGPAAVALGVRVALAEMEPPRVGEGASEMDRDGAMAVGDVLLPLALVHEAVGPAHLT